MVRGFTACYGLPPFCRSRLRSRDDVRHRHHRRRESDSHSTLLNSALDWLVGGLLVFDGFVVAGLLLVAGAVAFYRYRNGVRQRYAPGENPSRRDAALNGGVLAIAGSVVPFAVVGGGGVAGYLRGGRGGTLAGLLAGLIEGAPMFVVGGFAAAGAFVAGAPSLAVFLAVASLAIACLFAPFAAVGGLIGCLLADRVARTLEGGGG